MTTPPTPMRHFLPQHVLARMEQQEQVVHPAVVETVTVVTQPADRSRTDLLVGDEDWGWEQLRDYVVAQIEQRFGPFPRNAKTEFGIFSRFCREHGTHAAAIARYAFEVGDGWWNGSPISVNRFCKASDSYFSAPILERLSAS